MRNIGLLSGSAISTQELEEFLKTKGAQQRTLRAPNGSSVSELVIGHGTDWVHVSSDTSVANAYFDEEELRGGTTELGFTPRSYVDLHFTSTSGAAALADSLANAMRARWGGTLDYSGAGGKLGEPGTLANSAE